MASRPPTVVVTEKNIAAVKLKLVCGFKTQKYQQLPKRTKINEKSTISSIL